MTCKSKHAQSSRVSGFTILELLVVIAIIGVIISIVVVAIEESRARSRFSTMATQLQQIRNAGEIYRTAEGEFASEVAAGVAPVFVGDGEPMSVWPEPPCAGFEYDWENWSVSTHGVDAVRVSLRDDGGESLFYVCLSADSTGSCEGSQSQDQGEDLSQTDSVALYCS